MPFALSKKKKWKQAQKMYQIILDNVSLLATCLWTAFIHPVEWLIHSFSFMVTIISIFWFILICLAFLRAYLYVYDLFSHQHISYSCISHLVSFWSRPIRYTIEPLLTILGLSSSTQWLWVCFPSFSYSHFFLDILDRKGFEWIKENIQSSHFLYSLVL